MISRTWRLNDLAALLRDGDTQGDPPFKKLAFRLVVQKIGDLVVVFSSLAACSVPSYRYSTLLITRCTGYRYDD
jgi:hypothetical protein